MAITSQMKLLLLASEELCLLMTLVAHLVEVVALLLMEKVVAFVAEGNLEIVGLLQHHH